ncbi:hypothetical protein BJV74DRAFT_799575 [Russula compacta]|nr:hypothetical protein BJV74DRAFT_799575 [Russula compacta]
MPSASSDQSHQNSALARKISEIGQPRFEVYDEWRRAGRSRLNTEELPPGTLTIPKQIQDHETIQLKGEEFAAEWMSLNVRRTEDVALVRIPTWAVEGVTTCIFPNVVAQSWPKTTYIPINRNDASCLSVADIREKGKGCLATRAIHRGELVARERALLLMPRTLTSPRRFVWYFPSFRTSQVITNKASPAVVQTRCFDGIVLRSQEKSEHCGPSQKGKR